MQIYQSRTEQGAARMPSFRAGQWLHDSDHAIQAADKSGIGCNEAPLAFGAYWTSQGLDATRRFVQAMRLPA